MLTIVLKSAERPFCEKLSLNCCQYSVEIDCDWRHCLFKDKTKGLTQVAATLCLNAQCLRTPPSDLFYYFMALLKHTMIKFRCQVNKNEMLQKFSKTLHSYRTIVNYQERS